MHPDKGSKLPAVCRLEGGKPYCGHMGRRQGTSGLQEAGGHPPSSGVVVGLSPVAHPSAGVIIREVSAAVAHWAGFILWRPSLIGRLVVAASLISGAVRQVIF